MGAVLRTGWKPVVLSGVVISSLIVVPSSAPTSLASTAAVDKARADLGRRFLATLPRVRRVAGAFGRLRDALNEEKASTLESLRLAIGVGTADAALLAGTCGESQDLEARYEAVRLQALQLSRAFHEELSSTANSTTRSIDVAEDDAAETEDESSANTVDSGQNDVGNDGSSSDEIDVFVLDEDETSGISEETTADAESSDADSYGTDAGSSSKTASYTEDEAWTMLEEYEKQLERLAADLESHLNKVRSLAFSRLEDRSRSLRQGVAKTQRRQSLAITASGGLLAGNSGHSESGATKGGGGRGAVALAIATATERVAQLTEAVRDSSDPGLRSLSRRLGARIAALQNDGAEKSAEEAEAVAREAGDAIARVARQQRLKQERGSKASVSFSGASSTGKVDVPGCELDRVSAAAERFDATARGFRSRSLQQAMLPPEFENLQRVVHTMEVLRNSLLRELDSEPSADLNMTSLSLDCQRYLAGVGQLEADLQHYKQLSEQQRQQRRQRNKRKKGGNHDRSRAAVRG